MGYSVSVERRACPECRVVQEIDVVRHSQALGELGYADDQECPVCGHGFGGDDE